MKILDYYTIKQGDTIHSISQTVYGSVGQVMEIITANDLEYPFVGPLEGDGKPGIKVPGDIIIIPQEIGDEPGMLDTVDESSINGSDILLDFGDSGSLDTYYYKDILSDRNGDIQTISKEGSLKQDLIHKLITRPGTLVCHPDWGSNFLTVIGNKSLYGWEEKASIELERCFRSDDRVKDIQNIRIRDLPLGIQIDCEVLTNNSMIPISTALKG